MAKILHVEDDPDWREIFARNFRDMKLEFVQFDDILIARDAFKKDPSQFNLIICDGSINHRDDGLRWARELKADGFNVMLASLREEPDDLPFITKVNLNFQNLENIVKKLLNL